MGCSLVISVNAKSHMALLTMRGTTTMMVVVAVVMMVMVMGMAVTVERAIKIQARPEEKGSIIVYD